MQSVKTKFSKNIIASLLALLLIAAALPYFTQAAQRTIVGTVTYITDGDTIHVVTAEQTKLKVRLYGIDCPETVKMNHQTGAVSKPGQPYGNEAKDALTAAIYGKQVTLEVMDVDRYKRIVCIVWYQNRNINLEMVSAGYAEAFVDYLRPPYRDAFLRAQQEAKSAGNGIWSLPNYESPGLFRKRLKIGG